MTNCTNLLNELSKVAQSKQQQQLLEDLNLVSKQKELTPNQKALANKLYKELRESLITKIQGDMSKNLIKLASEHITNFMLGWKSAETHYPIKDIKEAMVRLMNKPHMKEHKNYLEILTEYGRVFGGK